MANTSKETTNYGLPQWEGSDLTDWFELNPAFETIDTQMKANADAAATAQATANGNTTSIANLTESLNNQINKTTQMQNDLTAAEGQIALHTTHLNEHDTAIQNINTEIEALQTSTGDTAGDVSALQADVTTLQGQMTTAQQNIATNADHIGNLSGLSTSAKTNLVLAINEVASGGGTEKFHYLLQTDGFSNLSNRFKGTIVATSNFVDVATSTGASKYLQIGGARVTKDTVSTPFKLFGFPAEMSKIIPLQMNFRLKRHEITDGLDLLYNLSANNIYMDERLSKVLVVEQLAGLVIGITDANVNISDYTDPTSNIESEIILYIETTAELDTSQGVTLKYNMFGNANEFNLSLSIKKI